MGSPDIVVPTLDTVRHESLLYTWLAEHKPLVLCGPPGSGKTMTLFSALRALPDYEVSGWRASSKPSYMYSHIDGCGQEQYCMHMSLRIVYKIVLTDFTLVVSTWTAKPPNLISCQIFRLCGTSISNTSMPIG